MLFYFPSKEYQLKEESLFPAQRIYKPILDLLADLTNLSASIFLPAGEQITPAYNENIFCQRLVKDLSAEKFKEICIKCHKEAFSKTLKTKKPYQFTCKFGLENIVSPIIIKNQIKVVLFLGQVLLSAPEKKHLEKIEKLPASYEKLKALYFKIPILTKREFKKISKKSFALLLNLTDQYFQLVHFDLEGYKKTKDIPRFKKEIQSYFVNIGKVLGSALDINELLKLIVEAGARLLDTQAASICLIRDKNSITEATYGIKPAGKKKKEIKPQDSLSRGGKLLTYKVDPGCSLKLGFSDIASPKKFKSYLGIPLLVKDEVKGILNIYSKTYREFSPEEIEALSAFASKSALAIDNVQVFEYEKTRAREATGLYKAVRYIGQSLDLKEVVSASCQQSAKIAGVDRCLLMLLDEKYSRIYIAATFGLSKDQEEFFSMLKMRLSEFEGKLFDSIKQGKPLVLKTAPKECPALQKLFNILPTSSCLITPLFTKENLVGFLYLDDSKMTRHFTEPEIKVIMTLAVQIATAIQRAKLVSQLEDNFNQLKTLYQVSTAISVTLQLSRVFNLTTEKAFQLMPQYPWWFLTLDPIEEKFLPESCKNISKEFLDSEFIGHITKLISTSKKKPVIFYNHMSPRSGLAQKLSKIGKGGLLAVPLVIKKEVAGILGCLADENSQFTPQEVRLLQSFATHSAVAIEKARLYDIIRNKVHELATVFQVGKTITSTLNFDKVLEAITNNILTAMKADAISIMLLDPFTQELSIITAKGLSKSHWEQKIKVGEGIAGIAVKTGRPMMLIDSEKETPKLKFPKSVRKDGLKTILSVPLKVKGEVIGLLNIYLKQVYDHTQPEINLLTTLANQAAIAIENARLYQEQLDIAKIVQTSLIPQKELSFPQVEIGAKYVPSLELSGDYYDFVPLSKKLFSVLISDVSGKGTPAAIYTAGGKYILKALAAADFPPREILTKTNQILYSETEREPERFISVFFARVDLENYQITYASAGHPPAILYKEKEDKILLLETKGILSAVNEKAKYRQRKIKISPDDVLVLYTDGITEARSKKGEFFGQDRLMKIIKENAQLHPQRIANKIYTEVYKFTLRNLVDDFTILIVKILGEE